MPVSAARWISEMTPRSNVADSRRAGFGVVMTVLLVRAGVVDVEVVEVAGGAVAGELGRVGVETGQIQQLPQFRQVLLAHLLLDAVGAEGGDGATHVDAGLVQRVAEGLAGVAEDDETSGLTHERGHVAD